MRLLFLSRWFPYPPTNGAKIRVFNLLKQLSQHHDVALLTFAEGEEPTNREALSVLRGICVNLRAVPYRRYNPRSRKALTGFLAGQPRFLADTFSDDMMSTLLAECAARPYDLLIASQLDMAPYALRVPGVPALLEELDLSSIDTIRLSSSPWPMRTRAVLTRIKLSAYLSRILPRFLACTVVSELDRSRLRALVPEFGRIAVVPNAVDVPMYAGDFGEPVANRLVYAGSLAYAANFDAVEYFARDIFPMIRRTIPELLLRVTGTHSGLALPSCMRQPGIELTGFVDDVRPIVAQSWLSVVPLRQGGGTRLKILESMALGTPVVSTRKGAEGLDVTDGDELLMAEQPAEFAARALDLLRSPKQRAGLAARGRQLVERRYDWQIVGQDFRALVEDLGAEARSAGTPDVFDRHSWRHRALVS